MRWLLIAPIRFYQLVLSPVLGPRCRFYPSCSQYGIEAIQVHGPLQGSWLTIKRILKCHPGHPGGVDLVPECCSDPQHPHPHTGTAALTHAAPEETKKAS